MTVQLCNMYLYVCTCMLRLNCSWVLPGFPSLEVWGNFSVGVVMHVFSGELVNKAILCVRPTSTFW